ncbi:MAG: VanW family protein [Candidatus Komeilibacteria bacterium]|nr:VanW family protein [Candidatus Komeilibacteria bacterium]
MPPRSNLRLLDYIWRTWWQRGLVIFFVLVFSLMVAAETYALANFDKIYPGVRLGSFPLGGLTIAEAEKTVQTALDNARNHGLVFSFRERTVVVPSVVTATGDPDLSYEIITYNVPKIIERVSSFGRTGSWLQVWQDRLGAFFGQTIIDPDINWRKDKVVDYLRSELTGFEKPAQDASLILENKNFTLTTESAGMVFDYALALNQAEKQLNSLLFKPIPLHWQASYPTVTRTQAEAILPMAQTWLKGDDIMVRWQDKIWSWPRAQLAGILEVRQNRQAPSGVRLGLSQPKLRLLLEPIAAEITLPAQEPKFRLEGKKVVEFKPSIIGQEIDILATWSNWETALFQDQKIELELTVTTAEPRERVADLNNLGIKELLGVGKSNFGGSPANRRHNIKIGAEAVNGTLLAPGEEFSLLKTLGTVDVKAGYLPELVIKGNKTVPEYGGGLCQIGTTTFRGTLAAGLPVTERRNHSYQVSYYANEKGLPGTDATIYDPAPDYRFKNDTANYVLIATRIEGDNLFFEYWGTKDGRQVEQSDVRVWDRVGSGPAKLIETLDLEPGKKRCTEKAHAGIKAAFDYKITYPDGKVSATTFTSQYRPWPEVCLIGVTELSETASTTVPVLAPQDASIGAVN